MTIALVAFFASLGASAGGPPQQDVFEVQRGITDGSPYVPLAYQGVPGPQTTADCAPSIKEISSLGRGATAITAPGEAASRSAK